MARAKMTPRKSTGPKGVPRHQLAPRNDGASSSSSRPDPQVEIQRISTELAQATRDRALDAIQVGELQDQLRHLTIAHRNCESMLVRTVEGQNEAWHRENVARARTHELEFYVEDLEEHNTYLHEEVYRLSNLLNPNHEPQADAMDPGVILANDSESEEEEEEDPEELVMINESDDEGGNNSGMDTEPEV